jgi:alpha-galactosidase
MASPVLSVNFGANQYFDKPLFSFTYGGKSSDELLSQWKQDRSSKKLDDQRTEQRITWTDPATGLEVRVQGIAYSDYPAVEWTVYFKNNGQQNTLTLENIHAVDLNFQRTGDGEFILHGTKGDWCSADSYRPFDDILAPKTTRHFAPFNGRPSSGAFPYYNLQMPGGGAFLAIGWPGQWESSFERDAEKGLHITAGQQMVHLYLKPGEEIRSPLIAMLFWKGSDVPASHNLWRRWMLAHNVPRIADGSLPPPEILGNTSHQFGEMIHANETNQNQFIDRYAAEGMKLDYWWMDAGWYPCKGEWVNTGTWEPDTNRFPRGLRGVSDHAHETGVKIIVWFEPERVGDTNSWIGKNHPEWLLAKTVDVGPAPQGDGVFGSGPGRLFNLGNPEGRNWLIDHIDKTLTEQGIDLYRQDFNMDPLMFWRAADTADRQGITENFYVQGYLAYWDALKQRHPNLRLDSCASGGRRNDLETMRRAVPLIRSDFLFEPVSQQSQKFSFASWIPYSGAGYVVGHSAIGFNLPAEVDRYVYRSEMSASLTLSYDMRDKELNYDLARLLFQQLRAVNTNYLGDFYPLTPYSMANDAWLVSQYDRPESGEGMVEAFRRPDSNFESARFKLHGLDSSAHYQVTDIDHPKTSQNLTGEELMKKGMLVAIPQAPGAVIITYKRGGS